MFICLNNVDEQVLCNGFVFQMSAVSIGHIPSSLSLLSSRLQTLATRKTEYLFIDVMKEKSKDLKMDQLAVTLFTG